MKFCPHCGGDLASYMAVGGSGQSKATARAPVSVQSKYDQTRTWKRLIERARETAASPPEMEALGMAAADGLRDHLGGDPVSTIVHLAFDNIVVPQGGMLHRAAILNKHGSHEKDHFAALGYSMKDGKVELVDSVPVGPAYNILDYWGGGKQHRRWHLAEPIEINPSRHGDPFFMDENMIAFGAKWADAERLEEGLLELLGLLQNGVGGEGGVARPVALEIVVRPS